MGNHHSLTDSEFLSQFKMARLDPTLFNHEAHLRLAWLNIKKYGITKALEKTANQIRFFVIKLGAQDKFNKTLTVAAVKAVYHFMLKSNSDNFRDFIQEFPRLKNNFKALMAVHYGFDIYTSSLAKRKFLSPDLLPFD